MYMEFAYNPSKYVLYLLLWHYKRCIYNHRTTKTNQKYPSVNL